LHHRSIHREQRFGGGGSEATITLGLTTAICRIRNGEQVAHSSPPAGDCPAGALHDVRDVYLLALNSIALIMLLSSCPARPTKGSPFSSSSPPALRDEHQLRVWIADAKHNLLPSCLWSTQRVQSPRSSRMIFSAFTGSLTLCSGFSAIASKIFSSASIATGMATAVDFRGLISSPDSGSIEIAISCSSTAIGAALLVL